MATTELSMKLLVDTKAQRVLFAEASKDVVDSLFSLLSLPLGTAVKLLGNDSMVGCVGSLYSSVEKLDATYVQPGTSTTKEALLHPTVLSPASSSLLGLPAPASTQTKTFYRCNKQCFSGAFGSQGTCGSCRDYITDTFATACTSCGGQMIMPLTLVPSAGDEGQAPAVVGGKGFVQGIVTYTVMDDLAVTPMSSISSITLLNTFAVKDIAALQEKTVQLGYNEGLEILKASLQSKTVLTDVFLGKKTASNA